MNEILDYKKIADSTYDWEYLIDSEGNILYCSPSCLRITGFAQEEFLSSRSLITDIVHKEDKNIYLPDLKLKKREGCSTEIKFRIITKDGNLCWIGHVCHPFYNDDGSFLGLLSRNSDISEEVFTEQALKNSEERYKNLFEGSKDAIVIFELYSDGTPGTIIQVNKIATELLGYSKIELFNLSASDLELFHTSEMISSRIEDLNHNGKTTFETILKHKDGRLITAEVLVYPTFMDGAQHLVNIIRDITDRKLVEIELKKSEEKYRLLLEHSGQGIGLYDLEGKVLLFNKLAVQNLGGKIEDYIGKSLNEIFGNEAGSEYLRRIQLAAQSEENLEFEDYVQLPTGKYWFLSTHTRLLNAQGEVTGVQVIAHDITEHKLAERKVSESEEKYRTLFNSMAEGAFYQKYDETLVDVNEAALEMFGLSREEFLCRTYANNEWKVIDESGKLLDGNKHPSIVALKTGTLVIDAILGVFNPRQNNFVWMSVSAIPQFHACEEKPYQAFVTMHDLTDRKQIEVALQKSEEMYRLITERSHEVICIHDLDGTYTYVSPSVEKILGYLPEELWGTDPYELFHPDDKKLIQEKAHRPATQGVENLTVEFRIRKKDGSYIWFETLTDLVKDSDGKVIGLQTSSKDISERKLIEEKLVASEGKLRSIFNTMSEGVALNEIIYDDNGEMVDYRILEVNSAFYSTADITSNNVIGILASDLYGMSHDAIKTFWKKHKHRSETQQTEMYSRGGNKWFFVSTSPFQDNKFVTTFIDITERKRLEKEQETTIELLRIINSSRDNDSLIKSIVTYLKKMLSCDAVGIRLKEEFDYPYYETSGFPENFIKAEKYLCDYTKEGEVIRDGSGNPILECMCGNIICGRFDPLKSFFTEHGSFWSNCTTELLASTTDSDRQARTRNRCNGEGYESVGLFPLRFGGETFGLLQINNKKKDLFTPNILSLLERLGDSLAIALSNHLANELLIKSEDKYRKLFTEMKSGFSLNQMIFDSKGKPIDYITLEINDSFESLLNIKRESLIGKKASEFLPLEELNHWLTIFNPVVTQGISISYQMHSPVNNKYFEGSAYKSGEGKFAVVFIDVTERKLSEEKILSYSTTLKNIFENTPYIMLLVDEEGKVLNINHAGEEFARSKKENLLGHLGGEIFHCLNSFKEPGCGKNPECSTCPIRSRVNYTFETKQAIHNAEGKMSFRFNGDILEYELLITTSLVKQDDKDVVLLTLIDLTERKKAEDALRESEEKYRTIFETAAEGILISDLDEKIVSANKLMAGMLGYTKDEFLGKNYKDLIIPEEFEDHLKKKDNRKSRLGDIYERRLVKKDGSIIWCLVSASPIFNKTGNYAGAFGMFTDITRRKNIELTNILQRDFNYSLIATKNLEDAKSTIFHYSKQIVGIDCGGLYVVDDKGGLKSIGSFGLSKKFQGYIKSHSSDSMESQMAIRGETLFLNFSELKMNGIQNILEEGIKCVMSVPLLNDGKVFAVFNMASKILEDFTDYHKGIAEGFALQVGNYLNRFLAEQELKLSEENFRGIFENVQDVYYETALDGTILQVSPSIQILSRGQYRREDLIGKSINDFYASDDERPMIIKKLNEQGSISDVEVSLKNTDGSIMICSLSAKLRFDSQGFPIKIIGSMHDITDRKLAEIEIREKEVQYRNLADSGTALIWTSGTDKLCNYFNQPWLNFTGRTFEQELGYGWAKGVHPDDLDRCVEIYATAFDKREPFGMEYRLRHSSGDYKWLWDMGKPNYNRGGEFIGYIGHCFDITERKNIEKELEHYKNNLENIVNIRTVELAEANVRLQEEMRKQKEYEMMLQQALSKEKDLNDLKTRFISTASHEFRTPLTSISLSAGLIQRYGKKWSEEKFSEHVERINSSIKYLTKLLDDVLTISRTESGKIVYEPSPVKLKSFCQELMTEISSYISDKHNLSFKYSLHKKHFMLDEKLLKYMLSNLLTNAFKYSPRGGTVSFHVSSSKSNLIFVVSDEGLGIPEVDRSLVYEPFHRSKNSIDIQGTGLGLSIVKKAVELHNGEIWFTSELNKGTSFTIKIPRVTVE